MNRGQIPYSHRLPHSESPKVVVERFVARARCAARGGRLTAPVILGRAIERRAQVAPVTDQDRTHVVGLKEPLVGVDRDRVGELQLILSLLHLC